MSIEYGIFALVILALDIWGIINVLGSGAPTVSKLLWIVLIVIFPIVGLIIWFLAGPRGTKALA